MQVGFVDTIVKAATGLIGAKAGAPSVGRQPTAPTQPATRAQGPITVSPAMQQAFTPQFSPVLQQTQDSPGAVQSASPRQYAAPGQSARSGASVPGGAVTPGAPGVPRFESPRGPAFPEAFPDPYYPQPVTQSSGGIPDLLKTGILALTAVVVVRTLSQGRRKK